MIEDAARGEYTPTPASLFGALQAAWASSSVEQSQRGTTLLAPWFRCVGRVYGDGMLLGSCVVLRGGRIALTAAHVVRVERRRNPYEVHFDDGESTTMHPVASIHWPSGEHFDKATGAWPVAVGRYVGKLDRIAILELEAPVPSLANAKAPYLPKGRAPVAGDLLAGAGFGEDPSGNHPRVVWVGFARHLGLDADGFATYAPSRSDLWNGLPAAGGSGGGIFWPPMANPAPPAHLRLAGVHAGRRHTTAGDVGVYLPIDRLTEAWIDRIDTAAIGKHKAKPTTPGAGATFDFRHRRLLPCFRFPDPPKELDDVELDLSTKGANKLLTHESKLKLKVVGKQLRMVLDHPTKGKVELLLSRDAIGLGGHWYTNDDGTNDCYYLFLVNNGPKPQPGGTPRSPVVHLEAFEANSLAPRPSACTIWDPVVETRPYCAGHDEPDPWDAGAVGGAAVGEVQDQDDEGNGHDPPT